MEYWNVRWQLMPKLCVPDGNVALPGMLKLPLGHEGRCLHALASMDEMGLNAHITNEG